MNCRISIAFFVGLLSGCESPLTQVSQVFKDASPELYVQAEGEGAYAGSQKAYMQVKIHSNQKAMTFQTNISRFTRGQLPSKETVVDAASLLSPYAASMANQKSSQIGPNCWHTALAALFPSWKERRFVGDKEFSCHLQTSFKETKSPKFGDIIRFRNGDGEVHGATYIGIDTTTKEIVTFTKNGYDNRFPIVFMSLSKLKKVYRDASTITFWEPKQEALNPEKKGMACYEESLASRIEDQELKNAPPFDPFAQ